MTNQGELDQIIANAESYPDRETPSQRYERKNRAKRRERMRPRMQEKRGTAKRFMAWDGEGSHVENGERQPYMLFGNSDGKYIKARQLRTRQCLKLILESPKDAIHFGFSFGYDVNQILIDLPVGALWVLAKTGKCRWSGYHFEYLPGKWFVVRQGEVSRKIFDVFHFFNCALVTNDPTKPGALDQFDIGTPAQRKWLAEQKATRPEFTWEEIEEVIKYWKLEGQLMVELMEYMRQTFNAAGFFPTSWHGPGALARQLLKNHQIKYCKVNTREVWPEVWEASRYAFSGGRFQQWLAGLFEGTVYNYDIHSAYPYAIQFLPNLATGKFRHNSHVNRSRIRADRFCLYHIRYDQHKLQRKDDSYFTRCRPRPLFRRLKNGNIYWPDKVEGWYWSPEAELVKNDPGAEFVEAWEFDDDGDRPLKFIADIYEKREYHKALGNAIEYAFKLAMNSCYGQFAQRKGWQYQRPPGPPPFHQLEYAGYVTSMCKAMVHRVAAYAYDQGGLITIDTDGVYTTVQIPEHILPNGIGDGLGQWEEQKFEGMVIWQNGFYWLKKKGEWSKARSRGAPRGMVPIEAAWEALEYLDDIKYDKQIFVGFRLALRQKGRNWRSWTLDPHEVKFGGGPGAKMQHIGPHGKEQIESYRARKSRSGRCMKCAGLWDHQMHNLHPRDVSYGEYMGKYKDDWSYKHHLPWLEEDEKTADPLDDPDNLKIFRDVAL